LDGCILETRQDISKLKRELERAKSSDDLDPITIISLQVELEEQEVGLNYLCALKDELF
jgi:hypothetical protein